MKIETGRVRATATRGQGRAAGPTGGFADILDLAGSATGPAAMAGEAAPVGPAAMAGAVLAVPGGLADETGPGEDARRATRRGHKMLDELEALRHALLAGRVSRSGLQALAARLAGGDLSRPPGLAPALADAMAGIELRVRVELAKFGHT